MTNEGEKFLKAWDEAGRPPVRKVSYPRFGDGTAKILRSEDDVKMWADGPGMTFVDSGAFVKLWWGYSTQSLVDSDGSAELTFERECR